MGQSFEDLIVGIQSFDRDRCIDQLRRLERPKTDFTDEFLQKQSLDQLRHILAAAFLQVRKIGA